MKFLNQTMLMGVAFSFATIGFTDAAEPPNILFISVDDLRNELKCYGVNEIHSPNIDGLAASGVAFSHAYCQQAVCNPSRVSLMTGLRPDSSKVWDLGTEMRSVIPDVVTLPQHFRQHGYRAVAYGKIYHNPFPDVQSWDEPTHSPQDVIAHSDTNRDRLAQFRQGMKVAGKSPAAIDRMRGPATEIQLQADEKNHDGKITSDAISKMQELSTGRSPFFLAVGFIRPHLPFIVPKPYWDLYDRAKIPLAENNFLPLNSPKFSFGDRSMGGLYELRDYMDYSDAPSPFEGPLSEAQQRELKHGYYASVSFIDAQIGRLLDELVHLDLASNTIVVLWGDHGWKLGEHGGWCKQTNYEIDTRAPLMIRAPNANANGRQSHALVEFVDVYPTLCELASLPIPKALEGTSLVPLLNGQAAKTKDAAFSQFPRTHAGVDYMGYAMRTSHNRYIEWLDQRTGEIAARELYDHDIDPDENENVAERPGNLTLLNDLSQRLWSSLPRPPFPHPFLSVTAPKKVPSKASIESRAALVWNPENRNLLPKSKPAGELVEVIFINERAEPTELVWLGANGSTRTYCTLENGETFSIRTRPKAVWLVRSSDKTPLGHFVVQPLPGNIGKAVIPTR